MLLSYCLVYFFFFFFKQKTAYEIHRCLEFRRVLFRSEELTFALAAPEDFWLHVAGGVPGSNVVVRNPDKLDAHPRPVVERAAELAARHSKARDARRVDVHLCRVADVSKPRGAPPGQVELRRWERVRVHREPGASAGAQLG